MGNPRKPHVGTIISGPRRATETTSGEMDEIVFMIQAEELGDIPPLPRSDKFYEIANPAGLTVNDSKGFQLIQRARKAMLL